MTNPAPIAYFAFNRPTHTRRSLAALAANPEAQLTTIYCFVDGPRGSEDFAKVNEVLNVIRAISGFQNLVIHASTENLGLYRSITNGVTSIVETSGRVIVVEDDIVVSPHFLRFMNDSLEQYESIDSVGSVHAYSPPVENLPDYFFLRGADCWGWGTWKRGWALFRGDAEALLSELFEQNAVPSFCESHGSDALLQLVRRVQRKSQSWAILWHASLFLAGRLTLHSGTSFVENIGNDGSGIHSANTDDYKPMLRTEFSGIPPIEVKPSAVAARALGRFGDGDRGGKLTFGLTRRLRYYYALGLAMIAVRHGPQ